MLFDAGMRRILNTGLCLILCFGILGAQKNIHHEEQTWFGIFNQTRFSKQWGSWTDIHFRLKDDFIREPSQFLIRLGPTYYFSDDIRLTVAYNYIHHFPEGMQRPVALGEHRPFQQLQWYTRFANKRLMQWLRLDERFRKNTNAEGQPVQGYHFNWRMRYNFALFVPLSSKGLAPGTLQILVNDELMINAGKNIEYNTFDQNRLFAGLVYQFTKESHVQLGYMNVFQQQESGNKYRSIHAIRLFYFHNIDLRKGGRGGH